MIGFQDMWFSNFGSLVESPVYNGWGKLSTPTNLSSLLGGIQRVDLHEYIREFPL